MNAALKNNENHYLIKRFIYLKPIMGDVQTTISNNQPNSKCHASIPIPPNVAKAVSPQSDNAGNFDALSSCQVLTTPTTIPHPRSDQTYHTPFNAVFIVTQYATSEKRYLPDLPPDKHGNYTRKLSQHMIMQYMIEKGHVPIRSTAFYKLVYIYLLTKKLPGTTWTEITAPGRNPLTFQTKHLILSLITFIIPVRVVRVFTDPEFNLLLLEK